jgi:hypothetical protein
MQNILATLVVCGLMGLVGQGVRAVLGLKNAAVLQAVGPSTQSSFDAAYLFVSLMIGFIAGILAGISIGALGGNIEASDPRFLLGIAAAGYMGTDFIENAFSKIIPRMSALQVGANQLPSASERAASNARLLSAGVQPDRASAASLSPDHIVEKPEGGSSGRTPSQSPPAKGNGEPSKSADTSDPSNVSPVASQLAAFKINGFDCDHYPGDERILWLRQHGGFRVSVCYLAHAPNSHDPTWIGKRAFLAAHGFGFLPTYVGLQRQSKGLGHDAGTTHGKEAANLMKSAGFAETSIVYLDLEDGTVPLPASEYDAYIRGWVASVSADGFTPGIYCSHLLVAYARKLTSFIWSFHVPSHTEGKTYDPANLPAASIDPYCIATQYRQNVNLQGLQIPAAVDKGGIDLDLCAVADPSSLAAVSHVLEL